MLHIVAVSINEMRTSLVGLAEFFKRTIGVPPHSRILGHSEVSREPSTGLQCPLFPG